MPCSNEYVETTICCRCLYDLTFELEIADWIGPLSVTTDSSIILSLLGGHLDLAGCWCQLPSDY